MTENNVVDARDRFALLQRPDNRPRLTSPRINALDRLKETTRTSDTDRILLARRLGEAAARLNSKVPKRGAHAIMAAAWGDDGSKKTGRLFIFDGKEPPQVLESSGASWAKLIEAAAALLAGNSNPDPTRVGSEGRYQTSLLMRGTSFAPASSPEGGAPGGVRELLERLSDKIIQRVRTNTRLFELWKVLEQAPFDVCHQPADEKPPVSVVPEAASLAGQKTWNMRFKADWRHYFVMQEQDIFSDTEWANVYIKIGVFAREVRVKTFIPPSAIADGFRNGSNHDAWDAFCEWQTGDPGSLDPYLPDHDYDDSGYGSTREVYTSLRFVHFVLRKSKSGQPEVYVFADNYYDDYYACPPLMTGVKLRDAITQIHPADLEMAFEPAGATLMAHVLPEAIEPLVSERYRAGGPVRIMHTGNSFQDEFHYDVFDERLDGSSISLTEDDERSRTLIYGSHDIEFVPFIETSEDPVTPARKGSLADALLRNASMPTEDQLISLVEHEAKRIAEAGLVYHESLVQHYREIIEKM